LHKTRIEDKERLINLSEEKLDFSRSFLILGNLALLTWLLVTFMSVWFYNQIYGWVLFLLTAAAIYMILRRLGCGSCYYCKSCTSGFGRLAGVFFGTGFLKSGSVGNRKGFIVFIYILLAPVPAILLFLSLLQNFDILKAFVFVCLLVFSSISLSTWKDSEKRNQA
jgi:hypothetical protein